MPEVNEKNLILTRAQAAVLSHDFTTAARLYKQLLKDEPSNVDYLKELAAIYVKNSEDEKAIPFYQQIINYYPHYIDAMNSLGAIYRRLKRYDESISILNKALAEGRQTASVNYNLGFTFKEMGKNKEAIRAFESVISENPTDVLAYNHLGMIYLSQKEYDKSINSFKHGLQIDRNHPILNYNLAQCYTQSMQYTDAIRCFESALKVKPGWVEAIKDFSNLLIKCQKTKEASDLVIRSIGLHPNDSKLLCMLGNIYLDQYDFDSAEKTFKRAQSVDSKDVEILTGLANALEQGAKPQEALDAVTKAMRLQPDNKDLQKQYVHTLLSAKEYEAAHDNVKDLMDANGQNDPQVLDLYGQYYICVDKDVNAQKCYDQIDKVNGKYKNHLLNAANRYNQIGKNEVAEQKAKEFIERDSKNPSGYNMLGKIYSEEGDFQKAIDSYGKSKDLRKPNILADKQIQKLQAKLEIPVQQPVTEDLAPQTQEEEDPIIEQTQEALSQEEEEFDFGTMGDNVPMGEALLEKEKDFFDELDDATGDAEIAEDIPEEEEEVEPEPEPEENPMSTFVPKENPYKDIEDESLSPFADLDDEPQSTKEQLVPDSVKDDDDLSEESYYKPEQSVSDMLSNIDDADNFDFDQFDETSYTPPEEPKNQTYDAAQDFQTQPSSPVQNQEPQNYPQQQSQPQQPQYNQPDIPPQPQYQPQQQYQPQMQQDVQPQQQYQPQYQPQQQNPYMNNANDYANQMQQAMMDSAKKALDTALNAQKMAQQLTDNKLAMEQQNQPAVSAPEPMVESTPDYSKGLQPSYLEPEKPMQDDFSKETSSEIAEFVNDDEFKDINNDSNDFISDDLPSFDDFDKPNEFTLGDDSAVNKDNIEDDLTLDDDFTLGDNTVSNESGSTDNSIPEDELATDDLFMPDDIPTADEIELPQEEVPAAEDIELPQNDFEVPAAEDIELPQNDFEVPAAEDIELPQDDFEIPAAEDIELPQDNLPTVDDISLPQEEIPATDELLSNDLLSEEQSEINDSILPEEQLTEDDIDLPDVQVLDDEIQSNEDFSIDNANTLSDFSPEDLEMQEGELTPEDLELPSDIANDLSLSDIGDDELDFDSFEVSDLPENIDTEFERVADEIQNEVGDIQPQENENPLSNTSVENLLPKIEKILEDDDLAKNNSDKLELFKKLLTFRDFLSDEEKDKFDSGKIRMLLEYLISKMSGRPGLLKTVLSLIKSGLLGQDYVIPEDKVEYQTQEENKALVLEVINIMKELAGSLEDKNLAKALCDCADSVIAKME